DLSEEGIDRHRAFFQATLDELDAIDRGSLDQELRVSLDILEAAARNQLDFVTLRLDRLNAVSHFTGPVMLVAELASLQRADTAERFEKYLSRLRAIPAFLGQLADAAREGARTGQVAPG